MLKVKWMWTAMILSSFLAFAGCAPEAEEKIGESAQDIEQAWEAERAAALEQMRKIELAATEDLAAIRTRAMELEAMGEEEAAKAYHAIANRLESARDEAARKIQALGQATVETWRGARDSARQAVDALHDTWMDAKTAVAAETRKIVEAISEKTAAIRARAVELEQSGEEAAARAWHRMADRMEEARVTAAQELAKVEQVAARGLRATGEVAADAFYLTIGGAALAIDELYQLGTHAAVFLAERKDRFVDGARAAWEKTGEELERAREKLAAAEQAGEETVRKEWHEIVTGLEGAREKVAEELRRVEDASEGAWNEEQHGVIEAYHDLRDASKRAAARLREA